LISRLTWSVTIATVVFWVVTGFLIARVIGLFLDGMDSGQQWMWVAVEAAVAAVPGIYLWRKRKSAG
jgi:hypothetical protein